MQAPLPVRQDQEQALSKYKKTAKFVMSDNEAFYNDPLFMNTKAYPYSPNEQQKYGNNISFNPIDNNINTSLNANTNNNVN